MKKRTCMMVIAIMIVLSIAVDVSVLRAIYKTVNLTFTGTTANCTLFVNREKSKDQVSAEVDLMHNGTSLQHWSPSGIGSLAWTETAAVEKGKTYNFNCCNNSKWGKNSALYLFQEHVNRYKPFKITTIVIFTITSMCQDGKDERSNIHERCF